MNLLSKFSELIANRVYRRKSEKIKEYLKSNDEEKRKVLDAFHELYYYSETFPHWNGLNIFKTPQDLMVYAGIIFETKPDVIIECGTSTGGSSLFFANLFDIIGKGRVISIDIKRRDSFSKNPRITYLTGSSTSLGIISKVKSMINKKDKVMVSLDSDHRKGHVLKELILYSDFVTIGSYLVCEDTNINGHPVRKESGAGPMEALNEFLEKHNKNKFQIDKNKHEKFLFSYNPNGYLKRVN